MSSLLATAARPITVSKSFYQDDSIVNNNVSSMASPMQPSRSAISFDQIKSSNVSRANSTVGNNHIDNATFLESYNINSPDIAAPSRKKKIFNKKILGIKLKSKDSHKKENGRHSIAATSQNHYVIEEKGKSHKSSKLKELNGTPSAASKSHAHSISLGGGNARDYVGMNGQSRTFVSKDNSYNNSSTISLGVNMVCSSLAKTASCNIYDMSALSGQQQNANPAGSASLANDNSASYSSNSTSNNMNSSSLNENSNPHAANGSNHGSSANPSTVTNSTNPNYSLSNSMSSASLLSTQSHANGGAMFNNSSNNNGGQGANNPNNSANGNGGSGNNNNTGQNQNPASLSACSHSGYLQKWTNYIKGYQKRWFVLNNGLLSYYRSQAEMAHTCRGTINLSNAQIQSEDACHFVVTNGGTQTFHLKAANEMDKQKWVSALELAKTRAKQFSHNFSGLGIGGFAQQDSDDEDGGIEAERNELVSMLRNLQQKLDDLSTSHEFVLKHSNALTKSLTDLESIQSKPEESTIKTINERSTLYKITMLAVVNSCQEFINLAQSQMRKMNKVLQSERDMRTKLEDMVQEMAKQHLSFETQLNKRSKRNTIVRPNPDGSVGSSQQSRQGAADGSGSNTDKSGTLTGNRSQLLADSASRGDSKRSFQATRTRTINDEAEESEGNNGDDDDENDDQFVDDEFHDAVEDVTQFSIILPRQPGLHQRNLSNISKLYLQESDISDEDDEHQTIKVTMHSNKDQQASASVAVSGTTDNHKPASGKPGQLTTKKPSASSDLNSLKVAIKPPRDRRKEITPRPNYSLNLWSIMKNCIGKDLSKIPIPVNFSEPLSMLQRVTEELEYSHLLDLAAQCEDQWEQMAYVAAFTITAYSTTATRTNKPFNPLLGETYDCDRLDDYGWRTIAEQVSHHPPGFAIHTESLKDWKYYQEFVMSSKFRGQYLQIIPLGTSHLEFKRTGHHYTWRKVSTFVRNIIVGKLWIDNVGEMDIINHKTKDVCHLKYFAYSYFSREPPRKVTGIITDSNNVARYVLNGTWTEQIEGAPVLNPQVVTDQTQLNTGQSKILWKRRYPPAYLESMYNFTELAIQLNELEPGVAPTDTRLRPDQRLMEEAKWDDANREKVRLEEKQRTARKQREQAAAAAAQSDSNNENEASSNANSNGTLDSHASDYKPCWFKKVVDPFTNQPIHVYTNEYWECKERQDWSRCPDLF